MSRHILDHDHSAAESKRLREYTKHEKQDRPSEASLKAQRTELDRAPNARLRAFTKIERE